SSRRRHTRVSRDWTSDVCSSDLARARSGTIDISPKSSGRRNEAINMTGEPEYSVHAGSFINNLSDALAAGRWGDQPFLDYQFDAIPLGGFKYGSVGGREVFSTLRRR